MIGAGLALPTIAVFGGAVSSTDNPVTIAPPSGFSYTPPFTITRHTNGLITHNFNVDAAKPVYTNTIYVGPGGTDTNTGLSYALRVRSLKQAVAKANGVADTTVRILADPGIYRYSDVVSSIPASWADFATVTAGKTLVLEPNTANGSGNVISIHDVLVPAFVATADANIWVSTYTTQNVAAVAIDLANLNGEGRPQLIRRVNATPADTANPWPEINAKWQSGVCGAIWLDATNKKIYIRTVDNRQPDANIIVMTSAGSGNFRVTAASSSVTIWARNMECWGRTPILLQSGSTGNITSYWKNCVSAYATGNSFQISAGFQTVYAVGHLSVDNGQDGMNYNGIAGSTATCPVFHELSCTSIRNGWNSDVDNSNNASSCHVNCRGVRINGVYNATNRVIHDIQDSQSWNLGLTIGPSLISSTGEASASMVSGYQGLSGTSKTWFDHCTLRPGSNYDAEAYAGGTVYTTRMSVSTTANDGGLGTIQTY